MKNFFVISAIFAISATHLSADPPEPKFRHQTIDDKQLDIIASGRATKNVKIYWNETEAKKN